MSSSFFLPSPARFRSVDFPQQHTAGQLALSPTLSGSYAPFLRGQPAFASIFSGISTFTLWTEDTTSWNKFYFSSLSLTGVVTTEESHDFEEDAAVRIKAQLEYVNVQEQTIARAALGSAKGSGRFSKKSRDFYAEKDRLPYNKPERPPSCILHPLLQGDWPIAPYNEKIFDNKKLALAFGMCYKHSVNGEPAFLAVLLVKIPVVIIYKKQHQPISNGLLFRLIPLKAGSFSSPEPCPLPFPEIHEESNHTIGMPSSSLLEAWK